ncbi:hypothetical protein H7J71_25145 [Mycolicibacterium peregrinum]|uniref:hypothetical protein n=1 Tax=Mycolicibacterium peregrinum TaxID=43304 RepID=UPI000AAF4387|nr:hypothetical protein [Mycolicibacterium peregrinum]MCV7205295.1 hypothetical protein [Mycolicibacterium peregrinum]
MACEHDYTVSHYQTTDRGKANEVTLACLKCGDEKVIFTHRTREQIEAEVTAQ